MLYSVRDSAAGGATLYCKIILHCSTGSHICTLPPPPLSDRYGLTLTAFVVWRNTKIALEVKRQAQMSPKCNLFWGSL